MGAAKDPALAEVVAYGAGVVMMHQEGRGIRISWGNQVPAKER